MMQLTIIINHNHADDVILSLKQIGVSPRRLVWPHVLKADYTCGLGAKNILASVEAIQHVRRVGVYEG